MPDQIDRALVGGASLVAGVCLLRTFGEATGQLTMSKARIKDATDSGYFVTNQSQTHTLQDRFSSLPVTSVACFKLSYFSEDSFSRTDHLFHVECFANEFDRSNEANARVNAHSDFQRLISPHIGLFLLVEMA